MAADSDKKKRVIISFFFSGTGYVKKIRMMRDSLAFQKGGLTP